MKDGRRVEKSKWAAWTTMGLAALAAWAALGQVGMAGDLTVGDATVYGKLEVSRSGSGTVPTNGLTLHYSFDSNESGIVTDQSGNNHTGAVSGATWTSTGISGGAYGFDGANDYLTVPHRADLNSGVFTVAAWVRLDGLNGDGAELIAHKEDNFYFYVSWDYYGTPWLALDLNGGVGLGAIFPNCPAGQWVHVVGTYDGAAISVYVNGESRGAAFYQTLWTGAGDLFVGSHFGSMYFWNGPLDEFRYYNRALSSSEVLALYLHNRPVGATQGDVVLTDGVEYCKPLGLMPMGSYTNQPQGGQ